MTNRKASAAKLPFCAKTLERSLRRLALEAQPFCSCVAPGEGQSELFRCEQHMLKEAATLLKEVPNSAEDYQTEIIRMCKLAIVK